MQSNIYTAKIHKPSKPGKLDTSEKGIKQGYKGRDKVATWKRGTDKRNFDFNGLQGA